MYKALRMTCHHLAIAKPSIYGALAAVKTDQDLLPSKMGLRKWQHALAIFEKYGVLYSHVNEFLDTFNLFQNRLLAETAPVPGFVDAMHKICEAANPVVMATTGWGLSQAVVFQSIVFPRIGLTDCRIITSDEVVHGRPKPDMILKAMQKSGIYPAERVAVVGDTEKDMQAGAAIYAGERIAITSSSSQILDNGICEARQAHELEKRFNKAGATAVCRTWDDICRYILGVTVA